MEPACGDIYIRGQGRAYRGGSDSATCRTPWARDFQIRCDRHVLPARAKAQCCPAAGGAISAQLLMSAQEQLRSACPASTLLAPSVSPISLFGAATPPYLTTPEEAITGHQVRRTAPCALACPTIGPSLVHTLPTILVPLLQMPTMPSLDSSAACTMLTTPSLPTGALLNPADRTCLHAWLPALLPGRNSARTG